LQTITQNTLQQSGYFYGASVCIEQATFPTRVYEGYTMPAGEYTALIVRLGAGAGDNWWCVVYPPLCFVSQTSNVVYRSKIAEIIRAWRERTA
jgi:stage II sporulation protein R